MSGRIWMRRLVTESGAHTHTQSAMADRMRAKLADIPEAKSLAKGIGLVYGRSGIEQRHIEASFEDLDRRPDWYRRLNESTAALSRRAVSRVFAGSEIQAPDIDALVVVSSSYGGFPSLSRQFQEELGFRLDATA